MNVTRKQEHKETKEIVQRKDNKDRWESEDGQESEDSHGSQHSNAGDVGGRSIEKTKERKVRKAGGARWIGRNQKKANRGRSGADIREEW